MTDDRLERVLSDAIADLAGTASPDYLDDILERTSRTRQRPWWTFPGRYTIMTPTLKFAAAAGLAFVLGLSILPLIMPTGEGGTWGPAGPSAPEQSDDPAFPTGVFVSVEDRDLSIEFHEDGSGRTREESEGTDVSFTYATRGNLWTEMSHDEMAGRLVPATYVWAFDGELLTFELWGEDLVLDRKTTMENSAWTLVHDPRFVVVAARDIPAGETIYANSGVLRVLPATEVGPGAFADRRDVGGYLATVDIAAGQPLTLDLMEAPTE